MSLDPGLQDIFSFVYFTFKIKVMCLDKFTKSFLGLTIISRWWFCVSCNIVIADNYAIYCIAYVISIAFPFWNTVSKGSSVYINGAELSLS